MGGGQGHPLWQRDRLLGLTYCEAAIRAPKREYDPHRLYKPPPKKQLEPLRSSASSGGASRSKSTGSLAARRNNESRQRGADHCGNEVLLPGIFDTQKKLQAFAALARNQLQACDPEAAETVAAMLDQLPNVGDVDLNPLSRTKADEKKPPHGILNCLAHLERCRLAHEEAMKSQEEEEEAAEAEQGVASSASQKAAATRKKFSSSAPLEKVGDADEQFEVTQKRGAATQGKHGLRRGKTVPEIALGYGRRTQIPVA